MLVFGPITSRRLGRSLGINHIPAKHCSYDCVYCQVGPTKPLTLKRQAFFTTDAIKAAVAERILAVEKEGGQIDAITFVPDGEPGLDINLAAHIRALKGFGVKIAIISNATLLTDTAVGEAFSLADWVSVKVDCVEETLWRKINRPYGRLQLDAVLDGIRSFAKDYQGELVTETMLIQDLNDSIEIAAAGANFIAGIKPAAAYLSIPSRPPLESWVKPPANDVLTGIYLTYQAVLPKVELMGFIDPAPFAGKEDDFKYLLCATTAVHPLSRSAVQGMLDKTGENWTAVEALIKAGEINRVKFDGEDYYLRKFKSN